MDSTLGYWVNFVVSGFPLLMVQFICLLTALFYLGTYPRVAMLVGLAFAGLLLLTFIQSAANPMITQALFRNTSSTMSTQTRQLTAAGIAAVFNVFRAVPMGLLCYAAFTGRRALVAGPSTSVR